MGNALSGKKIHRYEKSQNAQKSKQVKQKAIAQIFLFDLLQRDFIKE